jgi:hypothetical protein
MFTGFAYPEANWYRLPNDWFDVWANLRQQTGRARIKGPLLVTEYVIKHTWGWQNFNTPVRLSWHDFQYGRRTGTRNLDHGTGLARRALRHAITDVQAWGLLEHPRDEAGQPTYTYRPRMSPPDPDTPAAWAGEGAGGEWRGFAPPRSNFFKVPALWTDMSARLSSEVALLSVEYLFRHTWGWETWDGRACWLTEDEIAHGRQYAHGEERYDAGIGYSTRAAHDGLREALVQGLLVWRDNGTVRQFALYLQGMVIGDDGEFQGWATSTVPASPADVAGLSFPAEPPQRQVTATAELPPQRQIAAPTELPLQRQVTAPVKLPLQRESAIPAELSVQIVELIQRLTVLLEMLGAAVTVPSSLGAAAAPPATSRPSEAASSPTLAASDATVAAASSPSTAASSPNLATSSPSGEERTLPYIQTLIDTPKTHPSSDTHAPCVPGTDDVKTGDDAEVTLPEDIQQRLAQIGFHRTRKAWREVQAVYIADPAYVRQWLHHLAHTRAGDPRVAGFFRQVVLRERVPLPGTDRESGRADCPVCHGAGVVLDDRGEKAVRCPVCQPGSG